MKLNEEQKQEWSLFLKNGKIAYNPKCKNCTEECKQSWKVEIISCPNFKNRNEKYRK